MADGMDGHAHDHAYGTHTERVLWIALLLTAGFAVVEAIGGKLAGSLALLSDAGHMATDAAAFVVALVAQAVARRPPSERASYGYARAEVLAAFVNAISMLALVVWIAVEAVQRFLAPAPVAGPLVMAVAACGLAVNLLVAWLLSRTSGSLNARGALLHVVGDILGSLAALLAGAVVAATGWTPIDPLLSLLVALLILRSTWSLLRQSGAVLMERVPAHLRYADIGSALAALPGVAGVHDLHVWHMGASRVALSAHVALLRGGDWPAVLAAAQRMLAADFAIDHVTLQPSWPVVPDGRRVIPLVPKPMADDPTAPPRQARVRSELTLLLVLAAVQFTHIVDFMIMMPLGPQFMRLFGIGPREFGLLVSAYTFAAAASGFLAAFWIDRLDRKRALLALYAGFIIATGLCGFAPNYEALLAARIVAGAFGGVLGGLVFGIVADLVPYERRAGATAIVAAAFSLSSVAGIPFSLWLAAQVSWRAPFIALALASVAVALLAAWTLPSMRAHVEPGARPRSLGQLRAIFGVANHRWAFALMITLMFAGFTVIPFIAPYNVANVGIAETDLAVIYFVGGLATLVTSQVIGRLADRRGKRRVFTVVALISIVPLLVTTHLPPLPLPAVVAAAVLFFVFVPGRFGPAMALVSGSVLPRLRGSFMSFNASIQQLGAGLASLLAGLVIGRAPDGTLTGYGTVGWLAVGFTLAALWIARRIRLVDPSAVGPVAPTV